ncbi:hypothetical protein ACFXG4_37745 [Nocardia sp. NPDC059246]|uniref:hypothetical protein n=1 Tax=unclassified Nocardia TaxID=2637762 RepID=UPI003696A3A3
MHNNTIRTIGLGTAVGVVAGVATVATIIAVDTWDLDIRVSEAVARWRMTPDERVELDVAQQQLDHQARQRRQRYERNEIDKRSKFAPELLTGVQGRLAELPLSQLITEILYARGRLGDSWGADPMPGQRDFPAINRWTEHLEAMRSEFDRRRENPAPGQSLSLLDRKRWDAAHNAVHTYDTHDTSFPGPDHTTAAQQS